MLNSYFMKLKRPGLQDFYKDAALKNFEIFMGKHLCEIFKNTYFEEHLRTAASELTLESDCFILCFWTVVFKTILIGNITKIPVAFKSKLLTQFGGFFAFIFNPLTTF